MIAQPVLEPDERDAHGLLERLPIPLDRKRPALHPDHVEQVADQAVHPLRLLQRRLEEITPGGLGHGAAILQQARQGPRDGAEWRPQVVRQGAQEGGAQSFRFDLHLLALRPLGEQRALQGDRRLARERFQQVQHPGILKPLRVGRAHTEHADDPGRPDQRHV